MSSVGSGQKGESPNIEKKSQDGKPLYVVGLETIKDQLSPSDTGQKTNGRYRNRTCDPLIKSQLLCQLS